MSLSFYGNRPGPGMRLDKLSLQFAMHDTGLAGDVLEAYERLILDAMRGDRTLFTTAAAGTLVCAGIVGTEGGAPVDCAARVAAAFRAGLARPEQGRQLSARTRCR